MPAVKITKNIVPLAEAKKLAPDYVEFVQNKGDKHFALLKKILDIFDHIKRGQTCITFTDGQFVRVKVTSVNHDDFRAIDGPVVRVGNDEFTWRVDGDKYAYPI